MKANESQSHDLKSDLASFFNHEESKDIEFSFIESDKNIRAHKCILAARSTVFKAMFFGFMPEPDEIITIPNITYEIFKALIDFIYGRELFCISFSTVVDIYHAADQYQILGLINETKTYILHSLSYVNVCDYLNEYKNIDDEIYCKCLEYFKRKARQIFRTDELLSIKPEVMSDILNSNINISQQEADRLKIWKKYHGL